MSSLQEIREQIEHTVRRFQVGDLRQSMSGPVKLNFLAAIGLMVATEFLGGLLTGKLGLPRYSQTRFEKGFKYLGPQYETLLQQNKGSVVDIYENVRCGLVHQYLPSRTEGIYGGETRDPGIVEVNGRFKIIPENYIRDLQAAAEKLLREIETNADLLQKCREALARVPRLA